MDLESFLVSLYMVVDEWRKRHNPRSSPSGRAFQARGISGASPTRTTEHTSPTSSARAIGAPHTRPRTRTAIPAAGPGRRARRRLEDLPGDRHDAHPLPARKTVLNRF